MTDARYPEKWLTDRRLLRLPDAQHRAYVVSLVWSVSNRTDGRIEPEDLPLISGCDLNLRTAQALVEAGLWAPTRKGWHVVDFGSTQTSKHELEVLENVRRRDRQKKARQREAKTSTETPTTPSPEGMSPGTSLGSVPGGQHRQGKDRQGKEEVAPQTSAWDDVTVATPGAPSSAVCVLHPGRPASHWSGEDHAYCDECRANAERTLRGATA